MNQGSNLKFNKKNNFPIFIFIIVLTIVLVFLGYILFLKRTSSENINININKSENIGIKTYVSYDKDFLIVSFTNNYTYNIGCVDIEAIFYDAEGNIISESSSHLLDFFEGSEYIFAIDLPHDEDYNNYIPYRIDLNALIDEEYQEIVGGGKLYNDKMTTSYIKNDDEIDVTVQNNSDVDVDIIEVVVLFMKNGKPIYADGFEDFDIEAGKTITDEIDIPEDEETENLLEYDSIKVVVNRAYVY